jgi:hypothetical protein
MVVELAMQWLDSSWLRTNIAGYAMPRIPNDLTHRLAKVRHTQ